MNSYRHSSLGLIGLALVLGGCSDSNPTGNNPPVGTAVGAAQVAEMGSAASEGADETLSSMLETVPVMAASACPVEGGPACARPITVDSDRDAAFDREDVPVRRRARDRDVPARRR